MNKSTSVLACQSLKKQFDDGATHIHVLRGVDLTVEPGEQIAIMGASGCGKSTLLHLLGGLDQPTSGEVFLTGERFDQLTEKERCQNRNEKLGFIYQFHHLLGEFTAAENVSMPLLLRGVPRSIALETAEAMLEKVGLADRFTHTLGQLSGGERQRVAIARALVGEPLCVLADEPTGNLDEHTASQIYALLAELHQTLGISFVMVTHDRSLADRMDKTYQLTEGQLSLASHTAS